MSSNDSKETIEEKQKNRKTEKQKNRKTEKQEEDLEKRISYCN